MTKASAIAIGATLACTIVGIALVHRARQPRPPYPARRHAFVTRLRDRPDERPVAPEPPAGIYDKVTYAAPLGRNSAYVTPVHADGKKRPAIVWIAGGFNWSIDDWAWQPAPRANDQSARAFREAGMVEMLPSLRGGNDSPGDREYFLGEVDDVLAAIDFVRARPDVDPTRVYVGGHSTGGTLALLVAASRPQVRAVFAFGPVAWVDYGQTGTALDGASDEELTIRSPIDSLAEATAPIFVIEGDQHANADQLAELGKAAGHAPVRLVLARGHTHFSDLAPATELIAARLVREAAGGPAFTLAEADLAAAR